MCRFAPRKLLQPILLQKQIHLTRYRWNNDDALLSVENGGAFKTLSALAPGRIDYGVGRAPGGDQRSIYALSQGNNPDFDHLYEKLDVALKLIKDEVPEEALYNIQSLYFQRDL